MITEGLVERGWTHETTYIAYDLQVTRHCFGFAEPGWDSIQLLAESDRGGHNATLTISALEGEPSCESERREESVTFPPRQSG